jgi:putative membrane protein
MGVGFAVSRFGLFLRDFSATQHTLTQTSTTHSVITGAALVALGVLVNITAVISHLSTVKQLSTGTWQPGQPSRTAVALAIILALLGTGMAIYLIRFR